MSKTITKAFTKTTIKSCLITRKPTGKSECSVRADYLMADFTGCMPDALIREMRTEHICGRLDVTKVGIIFCWMCV